MLLLKKGALNRFFKNLTFLMLQNICTLNKLCSIKHYHGSHKNVKQHNIF